MGYVVINEESLEALRKSREKIDDHFGSYVSSEAYLNGLIDWDGNELE